MTNALELENINISDVFALLYDILEVRFLMNENCRSFLQVKIKERLCEIQTYITKQISFSILFFVTIIESVILLSAYLK